MVKTLDLATVLFLLKTSYLSGGAALAYVRWRSPHASGAGALASSFLLLAIGSTIAGYAEIDSKHYATFSLINIVLGALAYCLLLQGAFEMSTRRPVRALRLIFICPFVVWYLGWATGFHTVNVERATVFNLIGAVATLTAAARFHLDARCEPLPARNLLAGVLASTGSIGLLLAVEFQTGWFGIIDPVPAFALVITLKFIAALFIVILTMERANAELDRQARTDALTRVGNRRAFFEAAPKRTQPDDAVIIFDADRFKMLNDNWGHAFGDTVLCAMAEALAADAGRADHFARYGGEEFILFLPNAGDAGALRVAERARNAVAALNLEIDGHRVPVTVSAGISVGRQQGTPLESLIRRADIALYESKGEGGDRSAVFRSDEPAIPPAVRRAA